jgi:hypothetical protein
MVWNHSENIYMARGILNSSSIFYSSYINNSYNIRFSRNMTGCQECINCNNLTNQSYCIDNIPYPKEEYLAKKAELLRDTSTFESRYTSLLQSTYQEGYSIASDNVQGGFIVQGNNIHKGYYVYNVRDGKNLILAGGTGDNEHIYDFFSGASTSNDHFYGCVSL